MEALVRAASFYVFPVPYSPVNYTGAQIEFSIRFTIARCELRMESCAESSVQAGVGRG